MPAAVELRRTDPERADNYRELLATIGHELSTRNADDDRNLQAVIDDLARVERSLI